MSSLPPPPKKKKCGGKRILLTTNLILFECHETSTDTVKGHPVGPDRFQSALSHPERVKHRFLLALRVLKLRRGFSSKNTDHVLSVRSHLETFGGVISTIELSESEVFLTLLCPYSTLYSSTGLKLRTRQLSWYESGAVPIELLVTCTRSGVPGNTERDTYDGYLTNYRRLATLGSRCRYYRTI